MRDFDCPVDSELVMDIRKAIGMSRAGYQGEDNTCISTDLPVECVEAALKSLVGSTIDEYDSAEIDDDRLDVWGYSDSTPENECDWRIIIRHDEISFLEES